MSARAVAWAGFGRWAARSAAAAGPAVPQGVPPGSLGPLGFAHVSLRLRRTT